MSVTDRSTSVQGICVIILTMNQREKTLRCLESLLSIRNPPFRTILWDNGSQDGTAEAVQVRFPQVIVHHHPENLGVASGRNAAARMAIQTYGASHLLFLDNDMQVESDFVGALYRPFRDDPELGQTQAKLRFMHDRQRLNDAGGARINFVLWRIKPVGYGEIDRGQYDRPKGCVSCGGAMMVRADVFQQLGGFDALFDPFGPEDLDFSLRLEEAGYISRYIPQAVAYHEVSHTYGGGYSEEYARHKARHWRTFMYRHASTGQKLGFFLLGVPYLALRTILREGRRGNFGAIRGLARGLLDQTRFSR
jgi:GT2 family glycosyltransferase